MSEGVPSRSSGGVRISGLSKKFGTNTVLRDLSVEFRPGTVTGFMGPNGAGKSTLIKILAGVYSYDTGEVRLGDEPVRSLADRSDVAFIHQDLGLIDDLSVSENLRLGLAPMRRFGPILNHSAERRAAMTAINAVGLDVDVDQPVAALAPGEKTLVAVARAFQAGATTLFVDEATSNLPTDEAARVVAALRSMARAGATVVMVTHKLSEVLEFTDRIVVIIDGRIATDADAATLDHDALVRALVEDESDTLVSKGAPPALGGPVLTFTSTTYEGLGPIDLTIRRGEIVGLTGLPGSGLYEVAYLASGTSRPDGGSIQFGHSLKRALIPPHRETQSGLDGLSVTDNLMISSMHRWASSNGIVRKDKEQAAARRVIKELCVTPSDADGPYDVLSGGNKQKVLFGRVLLKEPDLYVLCEPTRGVDIGTRAEIYRTILGLPAQGAAVLVVSSDAEDLFAVCDRIGVVKDGRMDQLTARDDLNNETLESIL
ncbi:ATP-binding cassette domain-containing protein [Pseudarthrobacter sp. B4EP4b]|uniref:ATP-binding cassette domain-containing protein n=1 Tax=Pseudarthrobacter sp. B4EP4b TaxID=2590664 RepID=UPI00114FA4F3|nr:sugar ABC transporter ATP-binding protein [Pseudarthrobacter sp. B4EP4b]